MPWVLRPHVVPGVLQFDVATGGTGVHACCRPHVTIPGRCAQLLPVIGRLTRAAVRVQMAEHAPAYVVYGTPKPQFPTLCFIPKEDSAPSCTASQPHLFRLCACVAPAAGELLTDTIGSDSASGEDMVDEQAVQDAHEKLAKEMVARGSVAKKQSAEDQRATEDVADAPEEHAEPDDGT